MNLSAEDIEYIISLAGKACRVIMDYYNAPLPKIETKLDNSPVTIADKHSSDLIIEGLLKIDNNIPVVSEEREEGENLEIIKNNNIFWLIDPIDGTWSFIKKKGEFTVNIALIEGGKPVWGLIANPQDNSVYYINTYGKCRKRYESKDVVLIGKKASDTGMDFLVSHQNLEQRMQDYVNNFKVNTITPIPSSIKFALMVEGKGDIYPRFKRTCIWDTAAGHALLLAIGGDIYDLNGKPLVYNSGNLENPDFVAVSRKEFF